MRNAEVTRIFNTRFLASIGNMDRTEGSVAGAVGQYGLKAKAKAISQGVDVLLAAAEDDDNEESEDEDSEEE